MPIYLNISAKFYPDPIRNDRASGFFWRPTTRTKWVPIWDQFLIPKTNIISQ